MSYYFGLLGIIVCIIHNQEAKLIENFQEENVIVFQLQNDGKAVKYETPSHGLSQGKCIGEAGLNIHHSNLVMVPIDQLKKKSMKECLHFCMKYAPNSNYLLISYYDSFLVSDQFNCMCANEFAIKNTTELALTKCNSCPESNYRCGNAKKDILSAYCLHRDCGVTEDLVPNDPICARRLPHDIHGCIKHKYIDWSHAHNVRNFSISDGNVGDSSCIWECRDNHMDSVFALTRVLDNIQTCSCGYPKAFDLDSMVLPEFCQLFEETGQTSDYYHVNCVTDLLDGNNDSTNGTTRCNNFGPMGCIYKEILDNPDNYDQFKIQSTGVAQPEKSDVTQCLKGCRAMYPNAYFVGVLHKPNELECLCLQAGAFNASMLGPNVQCNQTCGQAALGMLCGSDPTNPHPSISLYCLSAASEKEDHHLAKLAFAEARIHPGKTNNISQEEGPLLEGIHQALLRESITTEIMVGLLTLLCVLLTTLVVYLCYTRGIASLSRYVM